MLPQYVYLGTWFQRTSLHLKEVYIFLKYKKGIQGLDQRKLFEIWNKLKLENVFLHEETDFDYVEFYSQGIRTMITEDGVILMRRDWEKSDDYKLLDDFYVNYLAPILSQLFSLGAPIPKELKSARDIYPLFYTGQKIKKQVVDRLFLDNHDLSFSVIKNQDLEINLGENVTVLNYYKTIDDEELEEFLRNLVFFREFEEQLNRYLNLHREIWEKVAAIRRKSSLRFKDFHNLRANILHHLNTLSFAKARLAQMGDILVERANSTKLDLKKQLQSLGMNRFEFLKADQKYISHLCQMTTEYVSGTLNLLQSLYEENTQRELSTLKFVTFVGVLTGFFGMNIAFPWEERWGNIYQHSFAVVTLILVIALSFYFFLRSFIYNRRFKIGEREEKE